MDRALPKIALSAKRIERLQSEPWRYGFFALMRRINANPAIYPVGTALLPEAEPFRLGQKPSLIFAPREIAEARVRNGKLHIRLFSLGMLGPNGPLPIHVTEIAREREEQRQDPTLCNFLEIFHHRSMTLLYRAWASAQSSVSLTGRITTASRFTLEVFPGASRDRIGFRHCLGMRAFRRHRISWVTPVRRTRCAPPSPIISAYRYVSRNTHATGSCCRPNSTARQAGRAAGLSRWWRASWRRRSIGGTGSAS